MKTFKQLERYFKGISNHKRIAILFIVEKNATKNAIKQAIEKRWGVKVKDVRTIRIKGTIKQRGGRITRKRKAFKKAIVSLEKGQKLELT